VDGEPFAIRSFYGAFASPDTIQTGKETLAPITHCQELKHAGNPFAVIFQSLTRWEKQE
jgi:hypothetical protein